MDNKELKQELSELAKMKETMAVIDSKIEKLMVATVRRTHPDINPYDICCTFSKECKKNPFGFCVYDEKKDPNWNECVYCGKPYEKKREL